MYKRHLSLEASLYACTHVYVFIYVSVYVCMCVCMYVCMCVCVCVCVYVGVRTTRGASGPCARRSIRSRPEVPSGSRPAHSTCSMHPVLEAPSDRLPARPPFPRQAASRSSNPAGAHGKW